MPDDFRDDCGISEKKSFCGTIDRFFRLRWPAGFRCPDCGHSQYTAIRTRLLPLYQCRHCRKQTSLTAGTIMHKSRTPLRKWLAAIDALSLSSGMSAVALGRAVGVTTKVAWTMLTKFRKAMSQFENERKLHGNVRIGLRIVAPSSIWMFYPYRRYPSERVVAMSAAVDSQGNPKEIKLRHLDPIRDLQPDSKMATKDARERLKKQTAAAVASVEWIRDFPPFPTLMKEAFQLVRKWLLHVFNGVGTKYLQRYLDEYCFRSNISARGDSLREALQRLCFSCELEAAA